ncbi:hypothetical protein [Lacipirellula sp.]|uniref:hypothetical protein n=1 Tax=Lacipirellula sp. TaxID=2691419 RepID=UPI003D0C7E69
MGILMRAVSAALIVTATCGVAAADDSATVEGAATPRATLTLACAADNDLYRGLTAGGSAVQRADSVREGIEIATPGTALLLLADGYPERRTVVRAEDYAAAREKGLKLLVEYPAEAPGVEFAAPRQARWERGVVAEGSSLGLPRLAILALHDCQFLPCRAENPLLVLGRVAGFDRALFGMPAANDPLLFRSDKRTWIATTRLSGFVTSRYAPAADWATLWTHLLATIDPAGPPHQLQVKPLATPAYAAEAPLPDSAEAESLARFAKWCLDSRLLITPEREPELHRLLRENVEIVPPPAVTGGDGSLGILEGYASQILPDGSQLQRTPIRADCQAETAAALALHARLSGDARSEQVATNLMTYLYETSDMCRGERGDPQHPAFGLIAWGAVSPAWMAGNYGDDNARTLLATIVTAAELETAAWDKPLLRALYANLRTTGTLGFRGDNLTIAPLEEHGWKHFHDAATVNVSPHFEAYSWACFLWAYARTGDEQFLEVTKRGIRRTMEEYPAGWRWGENLDRARMLLALAWLVRVEDTAEHRGWLKQVADDLLKTQQPCGGIPEQPGNASTGHFLVPTSNDAYGTGETPLIQESGDPVTDQLYVSGFVLLGLREAVAATGDPELKQAEDRLADYLVRVQVRSQEIPYLDGTWFRAFDYRRWDYWSSSGDLGWGAWCAEAGWGPAWTAITLGLRAEGTSLWETSQSSAIAEQLEAVRGEMSQNGGEPWRGAVESP